MIWVGGGGIRVLDIKELLVGVRGKSCRDVLSQRKGFSGSVGGIHPAQDRGRLLVVERDGQVNVVRFLVAGGWSRAGAGLWPDRHSGRMDTMDV